METELTLENLHLRVKKSDLQVFNGKVFTEGCRCSQAAPNGCRDKSQIGEVRAGSTETFTAWPGPAGATIHTPTQPRALCLLLLFQGAFRRVLNLINQILSHKLKSDVEPEIIAV